MKPRKKICFVVSVPMTAQAFLLTHFSYLSEEFDVFLVADFREGGEALKNHPDLSGWYSVGLERDIDLRRDWKALKDLRKLFEKERFDAVVTVTPKAGFLGITAAWLARIPHRTHVFTGQVWHTRKGLFKRILMGIDQWIFRRSTEVLVDGQAQRKFLIDNGIVDEIHSRVLGKGSISGVDTSRFQIQPEVRQRVRSELGFGESDVVFMFLGRLNRDKGIPELGQAFEKVRQQQPQARLLLVGYDEENLVPELKKAISKPESWIFYGPTPRPYEMLQAADVFCLPSHREGFGTSVIEAALLGKPVLCSDTYGLSETIVEGETGIRHRVGDVESLAEGMAYFLQNPERRKGLGEAGRRYVLEHFRHDQISMEWLEYFRSVLGGEGQMRKRA